MITLYAPGVFESMHAVSSTAFFGIDTCSKQVFLVCYSLTHLVKVSARSVQCMKTIHRKEQWERSGKTSDMASEC